MYQIIRPPSVTASEIRSNVELLGKHLVAYEEYMRKLGLHLGTTVSMYNQASRELGKVDKDILRVTGVAAGLEPRELEKPNRDDDD